MTNAATFFGDESNTRMCILYEYLRGLTPRQALNELEKAGNKEVKVSEIIAWFARFKVNEFRVDKEVDLNEDFGYKQALKEYNDADKHFDAENLDTLDTALMDFLEKLDGLVTQKGFNVSELEINVKNGAQPSHVLIGIEYYFEGSEANKGHHVVEIYHCGTGVLVRRGQQTKLCEGDGYSYYKMSVAVCQQVIEKLEEKKVKTLTLRIDQEGEKAPPNRPTDSFNFFGKLEGSLAAKTFAQDQSKEPTIDSSASLMKLARHVRGLEQLNLKYEPKLQGLDQVKKMKKNFDNIFGGTRQMKCTITIQVTEELITREECFRNEKSHVIAKSD
ncbi:unnamed protein product [Caenorhabditis brenneri]